MACINNIDESTLFIVPFENLNTYGRYYLYIMSRICVTKYMFCSTSIV